MTNAETNTTAAVAEQGAHAAPEKAASKKVATQKKGALKGQKSAKDGKAKAASPKKIAKASKKARSFSFPSSSAANGIIAPARKK